eukprot:2538548-Rhodomonas_salina.1
MYPPVDLAVVSRVAISIGRISIDLHGVWSDCVVRVPQYLLHSLNGAQVCSVSIAGQIVNCIANLWPRPHL